MAAVFGIDQNAHRAVATRHDMVLADATNAAAIAAVLHLYGRRHRSIGSIPQVIQPIARNIVGQGRIRGQRLDHADFGRTAKRLQYAIVPNHDACRGAVGDPNRDRALLQVETLNLPEPADTGRADRAGNSETRGDYRTKTFGRTQRQGFVDSDRLADQRVLRHLHGIASGTAVDAGLQATVAGRDCPGPDPGSTLGRPRARQYQQHGNPGQSQHGCFPQASVMVTTNDHATLARWNRRDRVSENRPTLPPQHPPPP